MALAKKPAEIVAESKSALLAKHESWGRVAVSDVAEILNGYAFKSDRFTNDKGTPLIRIRDVGKDRTNTYYDGEYDEAYLVKKGDLLVGMDGDFRCSIWRGEDALLNQRVCKITLKTDAYDFGFLSYVLQPYLDAIHAETSAVTVKHLSSRSISEIPLPLPPLAQQKRIVAKIEELFSHIDAGIAALNKAKQLLKQYRQSVLKAAVTGELTKQWREDKKDKLEPASHLLERILQERRQKWEAQQLEQFKAKGKIPKNDKWKEKYKEPQAPAWKGMSDLVDGWTWITIEQLASDEQRSIQSGPFGSNLKHSEFQEEGKLVVGIDNVREGFFSKGSENRISEEKYKELEKYAARPGDVLITVMATIGRTCVIPEDLEPAIITKHVYRITIDKNLAEPNYINMYLWGAPDARDQFFGQTIGQTRPGLNGGIIKGVCVPIPSIEEQKTIFQIVDSKNQAIDRLDDDIDKQIAVAEKNKQAVLVSAFSGKLVEEFGDAEPAAELLKRIAELKSLEVKAQRKPKTKKTKKVVSLDKLIDVLKSQKDWVKASEAFKKVGVADGVDIDVIETAYAELRRLVLGENSIVEVERRENEDWLRINSKDKE